MTEWFKVLVLKTKVLLNTVGSNPTLPLTKIKTKIKIMIKTQQFDISARRYQKHPFHIVDPSP